MATPVLTAVKYGNVTRCFFKGKSRAMHNETSSSRLHGDFTSTTHSSEFDFEQGITHFDHEVTLDICMRSSVNNLSYLPLAARIMY